MFMVRRKMVGMASSGLRRSVVIPAGLHGRARSLLLPVCWQCCHAI